MVETHGLRMPALFIGHGSPMNAIEDNVFSRGWADAARRLPAPAAVLCVSAHWETAGVRVTSSRSPECAQTRSAPHGQNRGNHLMSGQPVVDGSLAPVAVFITQIPLSVKHASQWASSEN